MGDFNPRSPQGERPVHTERLVFADIISIHAPRKGSDFAGCLPFYCNQYFNPRSPQGERREGKESYSSNEQFQSTLPARGATV